MYTVAPTCGHLARPTDSADLPKLVDFAKRHNLPKNDVNGALYHATMDMVEAFCKKIVVHKVHFHVSSYSVGALPRKLVSMHLREFICSEAFPMTDKSGKSS